MTTAKDRKKVIVIGLDGGTFNLLMPWIEEGKLPNLKRIIDEGAWGELRSTIPPITAPAWATFMTGKNPGKHGLFTFFERDSQSGEIRITDSLDIKAKKVWHILNEAGKKVGVVGIPMTYPAEEIDGLMISKFFDSGNREKMVYPQELQERLKRDLGRCFTKRQAGKLFPKSIDEAVNAMSHNNKLLKNQLSYFRDNFGLDFLMVHFDFSDTLQHRFYKHLDKNEKLYHSEKAREIRGKIIQTYVMFDDIIGDILNSLRKEEILFILSDHGFGPLRKHFYPNVVLRNRGLLKINILKYILSLFLDKINLDRKYIRLVPKHMKALINTSILFACIKWKATKAYSGGEAESAIFLNVKKEEKNTDKYRALCKFIRDEFLKLKDAQTGEAIVKNIYRNDEIYSGPYAKEAPDLIIELQDGYYINGDAVNISWRNIIKTICAFFKGEFLQNAEGSVSGNHRRQGIFLAYGKDYVKSKRTENAGLEDMAPTLLYSLGVKIPDDTDGKVITDIFKESYLSSNPIEHVKATPYKRRTRKNEVYSEKDKKEIMQRLKSLGYI